MSNNSHILVAKNIVKHFDHNGESMLALDGINFDVQEGDFVCIVGPSGCGKSTFLNIIAGLEKPDSGEILLSGKPISGHDAKIIMVFQEGALFPWLSVIDNVEFGLKMARVPKNERNQISQRYLEMMQLTKFANSYIHQLSTGMRQRVAIARALAMDPDILLMDEPFAALDSQTRDMLMVELQLIWQRTKKTILFVTHNVSESVILGDRVLIFKHRPSKIKKEIRIDLHRPRLAEDENLLRYTHEILGELKDEVKESIKDEAKESTKDGYEDMELFN
ncbi:MAG TPA: ABC transporter ATP-binding protein [Nitrosopumilaceae archaeon]|nr:ABC transporter ATP-binding protein [Nitrosopumilaceae archaeon]